MTELFRLVGTIAIESADADKKIEATISAADGLAESFGVVKTKADSTGKSLGSSSKIGAAAVWLGNQLTKLSDAALRVGREFLSTGVNYNAEMERYQAIFTAFMDNNEEAAAKFAESLRELSIISPLNLSGLNYGALKLLSVGMAAKDVYETMLMLGDISLGDNVNFERIALATSQIISNNRVMSEELNQLADAGLAVWKLFPKYMDMDMGTFRKAVEEGEVTVEHFFGFLRSVTSEEGLYHDKMNAMMDSWAEQVEKLEETAEMTSGTFLKPFMEVVSADVIPKLVELLNTFADWVGENDEGVKGFAQTIGNFAVGGLEALINGFQWLVDNQDKVEGFFTKIQSAAEWIGGFLGFGTTDNKQEVTYNFGGAKTKKTVDAWAQSVDPVSGQGDVKLWNTAQVALGGEEAAREFLEAFEGYLAKNKLDWAAEAPAEWFPGISEQPAAENKSTTQQTEDATDGFFESLWKKLNLPELNLPNNNTGKQEETLVTSRYELDPRLDTSGSTDDGTGGLTGALTTVLQGMLGTIRSEVAAGAQEGVSAGISGITVTGSISTGNVTLDTGAVVGQLSPRLNLALGSAQKHSARRRG